MESVIVKSEQDVISELGKVVESQAKEAISSNDRFRIGVSGGSLVKYLVQALPSIQTDWSKWTIFFCDERYVPEDDINSTFGSYKDLLIPKIDGLSEGHFVRIDTSLGLDDCAKDYEAKILKEFNLTNSKELPEFDLLLLGMGPDGHTCSLFPNHELLNEKSRLIAPINDSPKPPPERVTFTYPLINSAKKCVFAMAGGSKADMIKRIVREKEDFPAGRVNPKSGNLVWIFDEAAAGQGN